MNKGENKVNRSIPKPAKTKLLKKTGAVSDFIMTVGPHADQIASYGAQGLAAFGAGVYGRGLYKKYKETREGFKSMKRYMGRKPD